MTIPIEVSLPSGENISFFIHAVQNLETQPVPETAGLYMFCTMHWDGKTSLTSYKPVYIGQALSLKDRLTQHERLQEALRKGGQFVLLAAVPTQPERDRLEKALIQHYQPELNVHHTQGIIDSVRNS